jgi:cob(I)alamin adenosyltransferase
MPKAYTRTGDKGDTGLFSGERVSKNSPRIEAYGTVDELSSMLGYVRSLTADRDINRILEGMQRDLFVVGAELATRAKKGRQQKLQTTDATVKALEQETDRLDAELPALTTFIFPSGTSAAAALHVARSLARRAERRVVALSQKEEVNPQVIAYLNRLSSLLFVLARTANKRSGVEETKWSSRPE